MRASFVLAVATFAAVVVAETAMGQVTATVTNTVVNYTHTTGPGAGGLLANVHVVVVGKVIEIEPDAVEVAPFRGAPKDRMVKYKVANLKIEDRVFGASGVTRVHVGYLEDAPGLEQPGGAAPPGLRPGTTLVREPRAGIALTPGLEGLFQLGKHPNADFYVLTNTFKRPTDSDFAKDVIRLKKTALAMNDPVAALKAKDLDDRFEAARIILNGYLMPRGSNMREAVPADETKLLVTLFKELPWNPPDGKRTRPDGRLVPHRSILWYSINPSELGFKRPEMPKRKATDQPVDFEKLMDEATTKFLKENGDKIKIKRFVQK